MVLSDNLLDPPPDPIFGIQNEFAKDKRDYKINLTIGVYVDENGGKPAVMKAIKEAEKKLLQEEKTKNYLSIAGDEEYLSLTAKLIFNDLDQTRISMIQTVGGTSALKTGFELLKQAGFKDVSVSNPTWENHLQILDSLYYKVHTYDHRKASIDFNVYQEHLKHLPNSSVILLQSCNHNPTGIDFTKEQWEIISKICKQKNHYPFFDSAYQGFGDSLENDSWAINFFVEDFHDLMVAHSFSKSFAIYNERVGALFSVNKDAKGAEIVKKNLMKIVRVTYSNPPSHGALAIKHVFKDPHLKKIWEQELLESKRRINFNREKLAKGLEGIFTDIICKEVREGNGFFCGLPFTKEQIALLKNEYAIYMTGSGRISLPGLNQNHFSYVIDAFKKVKG
jgi:aspartate/tyrosine/aromatic aminotransferase